MKHPILKARLALCGILFSVACIGGEFGDWSLFTFTDKLQNIAIEVSQTQPLIVAFVLNSEFPARSIASNYLNL